MINKKRFIAIALNWKDKAFVIYIAFISQNSDIYLSCMTQITFLKIGNTFTSILFKYSNFADIFLEDLASELPKYIRINNHIINLVKG